MFLEETVEVGKVEVVDQEGTRFQLVPSLDARTAGRSDICDQRGLGWVERQRSKAGLTAVPRHLPGDEQSAFADLLVHSRRHIGSRGTFLDPFIDGDVTSGRAVLDDMFRLAAVEVCANIM